MEITTITKSNSSTECLVFVVQQTQIQNKSKTKKKTVCIVCLRLFILAILPNNIINIITSSISLNEPPRKRARIYSQAKIPSEQQHPAAGSSAASHKHIQSKIKSCAEFKKLDDTMPSLWIKYHQQSECQQFKLLLLSKRCELSKKRLKGIRISDQKYYGHIIESQLFENKPFTHLQQYAKTNECTDCLQTFNHETTNIVHFVCNHEY